VTRLVFLKLGGSLLTDKTRPQTLREDVLARLCGEISAALAECPELRLLVGHGSGSFGHVAASRYGTRGGVSTPEQWRGYAATARAASELNRRVVAALGAAGAPALPIQPSASAYCRDGELVRLDFRPVRVALRHGLVPVIHGDVALDAARGGTIVSTEELFVWLALRLRPQRIILAGDVPGVMTTDPARGGPVERISIIPVGKLSDVAGQLGGSRGTDVTGGMAAKVAQMATLLEAASSLTEVQIVSGLEPNLVGRVLVDATVDAGTRLMRAPA
jgi:isopentenyl phosphate kinase